MRRRSVGSVGSARSVRSLLFSSALALGVIGCTDCEELFRLSYSADYDGGVFDGGAPLPIDGGYPDEVWLDAATCAAACDAETEHCALYYPEWPDTDTSTLVFHCYEPVCL
jgi:hypothetical protein